MDGWGKHDLPPTSLSLSLLWILLRKQSIRRRVLMQIFSPPLPRAFLVRHSSLNYREFKTESWRVHSSRHFHSSHLKPIQTTSVIRTRTLSNLFAKRIMIPFCKHKLHEYPVASLFAYPLFYLLLPYLHYVCNQRRNKFFLPGKLQVAVEC